MIQIINREPNFRSTACQRVDLRKSICTSNKENLSKLLEPFIELMKENSQVFNLNNLKDAASRVEALRQAKIRKLKREQNGGFILISGLTCIGTLIVGTVIFMTIEMMLK